jgi:hypothetical protein
MNKHWIVSTLANSGKASTCHIESRKTKRDKIEDALFVCATFGLFLLSIVKDCKTSYNTQE